MLWESLAPYWYFVPLACLWVGLSKFILLLLLISLSKVLGNPKSWMID